MQTHTMFTFLSTTELTERKDELEDVTSQLLSDVTDLLSSHADIAERLEVLEAAIIGNNWSFIHSYGCILILIRFFFTETRKLKKYVIEMLHS